MGIPTGVWGSGPGIIDHEIVGAFVRGIAAAHAEADSSLAQVSLLRDNVNSAADSLRLTLLRYQAGEATDAIGVVRVEPWVSSQGIGLLAHDGRDDLLAVRPPRRVGFRHRR